MEKKSDTFQIHYYIELVLKRRWLIIIPFCLAMLIGIVLSFALPQRYKTSALILERPQSVPQDYVQNVVTSDLGARVETISKQILSRTNLEKIINQFNLFMEPDQENLYVEEKIAILRDSITIQTMVIGREAGSFANAFSVSYEGSDAERAAAVANGLSALFIDENLRVRETQAKDTGAFLEDELQAAREELVILEDKIKKYRDSHMGELPEQLETNLRMLDRLQAQLNRKQDSLRSAKDRLNILEDQIKANNILVPTGEFGEGLTLPQLKQMLFDKQTSYTERHPDVIRLKSKIAEMEGKIKSGEYESEPSNLASARSFAEISQMRKRAELEAEIKNLKIDIGNINDEITEYQKRVENAPSLEQELQILQRDYKNINTSYQSLLNRKLETNIAVNMERKQKGSQFQIIEPARAPLTPTFPNMKLLFVAVNFIALHFGIGLILLIDYFDTSIKSSGDFDHKLGISLLATIPKIFYAKDLRRQRLRKLMTAVSLFVSVCLFAGFTVVTIFGPEPTLELLRNILDSQNIS